MSESIHEGLLTGLGFGNLPGDVWDDTLAVCERFEEAWSSSCRIEDYLGGCTGVARRFRLLKLLEVDLEQRRSRGDSPHGADYLARFPDEEAIVAAAFQEVGLPLEDRVPRAEFDSTIRIRSADTANVPSAWTPGHLPQLAGYELLEQIGEGGMGVVFKARQHKPDRVVAVKMIKAAHAASPEARQRFDVEVHAAGGLRHPHIVAVHEYGEVDGQPYFTMDYIQGRSLADGRREPLAPRQAAQLVRTVALAIQSAHDRGLLHRDLKPSNILIDEEGEPYVTDFGLAKAFSIEEAHVTASGEVLGTPSYMPPEQAEGRHDQTDRRSDVYSLGAVLYSLLAGRPPFTAASRMQIIRQVIHDDPVPLRRLAPGLPRDLETICLKCLEKSPGRRYATARDLADDLDRFLRGEPTQARPAGVAERTVRWMRRNKWRSAAIALGAAAVLLVAGLAVTQTVAAQRERRSRTRTESLLRLAEARQASLQYEKAVRAWEARDLEAGRVALNDIPRSQCSLEYPLLCEPWRKPTLAYASLVDDYFGILAAATSPDGQRLVAAYATGTVLVWDLASGRVQRRLCEGRWDEDLRRRLHHFEARPENSQVAEWGRCYTALAWLARSGMVAGVSLDGAVAVLDTDQGQIREIAQLGEPLYALAATPDGSTLLCGGSSGKLYAVSAAAEQEPKSLAGTAAVTALELLPGDPHCLVGRADGSLQLVVTTDLTVRSSSQVSGTVWSIAAAARDDGWLAAVGSDAAQIDILAVPGDASSLESRLVLRPPQTADQLLAYHAVRFGRQGDRLYAVDSRGQAASWDLTNNKVNWRQRAVTLERKRATLDQAAKDRGLATGLPPPFQRVVSFIEEGLEENRLMTAGDDGAIALWPLSGAGERGGRRLATSVGKSPRVSFDASRSGLLWALDQTGRLSVLDCRLDRVLASRQAHAAGTSGLTRVSNAGPMVTVGADAAVHFWRFEAGQIRAAGQDIRHDAPLLSVAASPDGGRIAAVDATGRLIVWDRSSGRQIFLTELGGQSGDAAGGASSRPLTGRVAFNRDGSRLSAFGVAQTACIFETAPFRRLPEQIQVAGYGGTAMIWSPVLPGLVIAADDFPRYPVLAFDGRPGDLARDIASESVEPESTCVAMDATSDARRVVLAEREGLLSFLDAEHFVRIVTLRSEFHDVADLAIDPGADRLAVAAAEGAIEVWEAEEPLPTEEVPVDDATDQWSSAEIVEPTAAVVRTASRMIDMNAAGRLGLLYVESWPGNYKGEGALHFVAEDGGFARRQRLEIGDGTYARRAKADAVQLVLGPGGEPTVAVRLRTAVESPYDGSIHVGQRTAEHEWEFQTIHQHGNMGFYPVLRLDRAGRPAELLHFSFGGFYLVRSTPGERPTEEWTAEVIGQQGDGLHLAGAEIPDGSLRLMFSVNRFNNDPASPVLARWDGRQLTRQAVASYQLKRASSLAFAPDGSPVMQIGERLLRLTPSGWVEHATLPPLPVESFAIGHQGEVSFLSWDAHKARILLSQSRGKSWSTTAIAEFPQGDTPDVSTLRLGPHGEPVVVVGRQDTPYGWLRILRRKA